MITVRPIESSDLEAVLALGRVMHDECTTTFPESEPERIAASIGMFRQPHAFGRLAWDRGTAIGVMTAFAGPWCFSSAIRAAVDILFVTPEQRRGGAARALLAAFENWAKAMGASHLILGTTTGIDAERTAVFFERYGYCRVGTIHMKAV